jgi:hypothetical protein
LRLSGLGGAAGEQLLAEHELTGSPQERARLVQIYDGNPLALNLVAQTIADLFGGEIRPFLSAESPIFGGITELLDEQWARLSPLEQTVLYWLAILREPVTLEDLLSVLVAPLAPTQVLEAVDGLRRHNLIERGQQAGSFTLQSVVLEFVTGRLVTTASQEYAPQMHPYFIHSTQSDPYFMLSSPNDQQAVGHEAMQPPWWQVFLSTAGMLAVINSVLAGSFVGLLLAAFTLSLWVCASAGVVAFRVSLVLHQRYQWSQWMRVVRTMHSLFPSQPEM